jgi:sulfate/thiosulfate-binding protein
MSHRSFRRHITLLLVAGAMASGQFLQASSPVPNVVARSSVTLDLVAYSTPQEAYGLLIPAFEKTKAGNGVTIQSSFGASGDQSRKVAQGLPADLVAFSLAPDVTRLVTAKLVKASWTANAYHGMVTDSVVVFGVRKGNPKHIKTWADLLKPGVDVITPNPFTSGGARWNVMAAYGAQRALGKSQSQAVTYLRSLFAHVSVQDSSARAELQTFLGGKGDVMLAYENEIIGAQQKGQKIDYVIPPQTILIENPVAVTATSKHPAEATAFLNFVWSPAAQRSFGQKGYRPVNKGVLRQFHFKTPAKLFTISSVGGWNKVQKQFFDPNSGIMVGIERSKGH